MNKALLLIIFIAYISSSEAQLKQIRKINGGSISTTQIDELMKRLIDTAEVTGVCIGIINDNKPVYVKTYGYKNKEKGELLDTSTVFYAASFSKSVFAFTVMHLVEEGKLDLDKPLYQYLPKPIPEYDNYKDLAGDDRWKLITARHCLSHTTGFPNWRNLNPNGNRKLEIFFKPGERYAYSGEGLQLLQLAVEAIAGRGLEELAKEKVFIPFGMINTSYQWQPRFENNNALGYDVSGNPLRRYKTRPVLGAGSMETTIADYTRFNTALLQGKGLSEKARKEMLSPQIGIYNRRQFPSLNNDTTSENKKIQLSYGLGFGMLHSPYGWAYFKEGHDDGWEHFNISFPDKKTSLIIMTNSSNGESIFKEMLEEIIGDVYTPWQWEGYVPYFAYLNTPAKELNDYLGTYKMGDMEAVVSSAEGKLFLEAEKGGVKKQKLYLLASGRYRLREFPVEIDFQKDSYGNVIKMIAVVDGSDRNEFTRVK
jgi:CubicO group peptidase (beta-lactamase class C family)